MPGATKRREMKKRKTKRERGRSGKGGEAGQAAVRSARETFVSRRKEDKILFLLFNVSKRAVYRRDSLHVSDDYKETRAQKQEDQHTRVGHGAIMHVKRTYVCMRVRDSEF